MRTLSTKRVETMSFERLSSWSIVIGASKELYKRYDTNLWAFLAFGELAIIVWIKL